MKTGTKSVLFTTVATLLLSASTSVIADDCDVLQVFDNEQGKLSLDGYTFGEEAGDTRALRAPISNLGLCENGVTISAPNARLPVGLQDDRVTRFIKAYDALVTDWETGKLEPGFVTRFQIEPEISTQLEGNASLTFRRMVFSPSNGSSEVYMHLDFTVDAVDSGSGWALRAHIDSPENGMVEDIPLGVIGPHHDGNVRAEVLFEYVYSQVPGQSKIRLSTLGKGGDEVVWGTHLNGNSFLMRQIQGLVRVHHVNEDRLFKIRNCLPQICAKSLGEK
jgi:hypothetical protein